MLALMFCFMSNILWHFRFLSNAIGRPSFSCRYFKLFERSNKICTALWNAVLVGWNSLSNKWSCTFSMHVTWPEAAKSLTLPTTSKQSFSYSITSFPIFFHKNDSESFSYISIITKMIFFWIILFFLLATSAVGDLIGWNRLQGAVIRSTAKQAKFKQLKSVFDQYLIHLERNSPQQMSKLIQIKKLQYHGWSDRRSVFGLVRSGVQYQKYLETVAWLIFTTTYL